MPPYPCIMAGASSPSAEAVLGSILELKSAFIFALAAISNLSSGA